VDRKCGQRWRIVDHRRASTTHIRPEYGQTYTSHERSGQLLRFPNSEKGDDKIRSVVDCDGKILFTDETVRDPEVQGSGYIEEHQFKRVWVGQDFRKHVLSKGSNILESDPEGQLLLVREGERHRLFNVALDRFVGTPFDHAQAPTKGWLEINSNGYYGLMDSKGVEVLPPTHYELMLWGKDRIWSRQLEANGEILRLPDASGKVLFERKGALVIPVSDGDSQNEGAPVHSISEWDNSGNMVASVFKTFSTQTGSYFVQEWVRRDGAVALTSVQRPAGDPKAVLTEGVSMLIGRASSQPLYENENCNLPDSICEALKI
jgi:hypothetical protein